MTATDNAPRAGDDAGTDHLRLAYENLRTCQRQLDMDGCMVGVSRQALEEVLIGISSLQRTITALESENSALRKAVPAELRALSERATPGPWEDDCLTVREDGGRYDARQAIDQSGRALFDSSNSDVQLIEHDYDGEGIGWSWDEQDERDIKFAVKAVNYVRALIAAEDSARLATEHGEG